MQTVRVFFSCLFNHSGKVIEAAIIAANSLNSFISVTTYRNSSQNPKLRRRSSRKVFVSKVRLSLTGNCVIIIYLAVKFCHHCKTLSYFSKQLLAE